MAWLLSVSVLLASTCAAEVSQGHNEVVVLEGQEADLPCVTTPTQGNGQSPHLPHMSPTAADDHLQRPQLILWYRDGVRSTIYSYDGRDRGKERHWSERRSLGGALNLTLPPTPRSRPQLAFLRISHAQESDAGVYRCRVDFYRAPSRNTHTKLVIVAPPTEPKVEVWTGGRWVEADHGTPAATVEAGTRLRLRCSTTGGRPGPSVTWWRGGQQLLGEKLTEEQDEGTTEEVVRSSISVNVRPEDAHTPVVCQASNTHLVPPLRTPVHLLVLSSPSWVRVVGADKPMSAGVSYTVECRSRGARPPPVLTWSVGDQQHIHASATTNAEGETVSRLVYKPRAAHAGSHLTCTARPPDHALSSQTTPKIWVKSDSVPLNIMYKPEVELDLQRTRPSPAGTDDVAADAKPPRRRPPFSPSLHRTKNLLTTDMETSKSPSVAATKRDDKGKTRKKLLNSDDDAEDEADDEARLVEGEGAVLQCHVRANPPAYHVSWSKDGAPLSPGAGGGLVVGNMSVVFPSLQRKDASTYTCTAHNPEGSTRSNPIHLLIVHGPECLRDTVQVLGVPRHHALNVTCQVAAYPPPTTFSWALKSTRGLLQVPEDMITFVGSTSWISYTPRAAMDYGELLCWAHTTTGRQREPCVARLVPADKPDAPEQCGVSRATATTLTVSCTAAHDGGLPQTFFMTVFLSEKQVSNISSVTSEITAYDLEPDTQYRLTLWSANTHGTSRRTTLFGTTAPSNASTTSSMNGHSNTRKGPITMLGPSLVAVVVVVTVLGVVMGVVLGVLTQRISVPHRFSQEPEDEEEPPPTQQVTSRSPVNVGRLGKGSQSFIEDLGKPPARYNITATDPYEKDSHVYDDPVTLRRGRAQLETLVADTKVAPNTEYPPFSSIATDLDTQTRFSSWHLPNSRLLRSKIDLRVPSKLVLRKPVRVEPPKLPAINICKSITPTRTKAVPTLEFRLILIPETSKMLQFAIERDTRLLTYLSQDSTVSSSSPKFPIITEEEKAKPMRIRTDLQRHKNYSSTLVTPYESIPVHRRPSIENDNLRKNATLKPIQEDALENISINHQQDTTQRPSTNTDRNGNARPASPNNTDTQTHQTTTDIDMSDYDNLQIPPSSTPSRPEETTTSDTAGVRKPTIAYNTRSILQRNEDKKKQSSLRPRPYSIPNSNPLKRVRIAEDHSAATPTMDCPLLPGPRVIRVPGGGEGRYVPSIPLVAKHYPYVASIPLSGKLGKHQPYVPSIPLASKMSKHHPYVQPLASIKRGLKTPTPPSSRRLSEPLIPPGGAHSPQPPTSAPPSAIRKSRRTITSLFSLSSSSSSCSSSSSSCFSRWGKRSREATPSPFADFRRHGSALKRSSFGSFLSRPRSMHASSGPEHAFQCCADNDWYSSVFSSPRSSSSSSCQPHSSSSSSPVSSFYSSENSLSISATLSNSSSASSFQFTSSSSSTTSSSPFSSFLSPSLTSPSSSSFLSLASCSTSPDSVLSGQITPT